MLTVTAYSVKEAQRKTYTVYENNQEAKIAGIASVLWEDAITGDYICTSNGYYVPVLYASKKNAKHNVMFGEIHIPGLKWHCFFYPNTHKFAKKQLIYDRDHVNRDLPKRLPAKARMLAHYIIQGYDFTSAAELVFPYRDKRRVEQALQDCFKYVEFWNLLKENHVKTMSETMNDAGLTPEFLAEQLKKIIDSEEATASVKKGAIALLVKIHELDAKKPKKPIPGNGSNTYFGGQIQHTEEIERRIRERDLEQGLELPNSN